MTMRTVYFVKPIGMDGPIKIGFSNMPKTRLKTHMLTAAFPLEIIATVPGDSKVETRLHKLFAAERLRGEWFRPSDRLVAAIAQIKSSPDCDIEWLIGAYSTDDTKPSFEKIIEDLGGPTPFSELIGVESSHARTMKARNSVPPKYWPAVISGLREHGRTITYESLIALRCHKQRRRAA